MGWGGVGSVDENGVVGGWNGWGGSVDENGVGWCGVVGGWNGWGVWMRME